MRVLLALPLFCCVAASITCNYSGTRSGGVVSLSASDGWAVLHLKSFEDQGGFSTLLAHTPTTHGNSALVTLRTSSTAFMLFKQDDEPTQVLNPRQSLESVHGITQVRILEMSRAASAEARHKLLNSYEHIFGDPLVHSILYSQGDFDLVTCDISVGNSPVGLAPFETVVPRVHPLPVHVPYSAAEFSLEERQGDWPLQPPESGMADGGAPWCGNHQGGYAAYQFKGEAISLVGTDPRNNIDANFSARGKIQLDENDPDGIYHPPTALAPNEFFPPRN